MNKNVTLDIEGENVRFTEDGKISVIDAIAVLSEDDCPACIWEKLMQENPQLATALEEYSFKDGESVIVADSESWEIIEILLLDYLINHEKKSRIDSGRHRAAGIGNRLGFQ